jgi:hypothetical protein
VDRPAGSQPCDWRSPYLVLEESKLGPSPLRRLSRLSASWTPDECPAMNVQLQDGLVRRKMVLAVPGRRPGCMRGFVGVERCS